MGLRDGGGALVRNLRVRTYIPATLRGRFRLKIFRFFFAHPDRVEFGRVTKVETAELRGRVSQEIRAGSFSGHVFRIFVRLLRSALK